MRVPKDADRDFVAGALIIKKQEILLIDHDKHGMWLPPGGHVDPGETLDETAVRESKEETGFEIDIIAERDQISEDFYIGLP